MTDAEILRLRDRLHNLVSRVAAAEMKIAYLEQKMAACEVRLAALDTAAVGNAAVARHRRREWSLAEKVLAALVSVAALAGLALQVVR